jgi:hypothetical protein
MAGSSLKGRLSTFLKDRESDDVYGDHNDDNGLRKREKMLSNKSVCRF